MKYVSSSTVVKSFKLNCLILLLSISSEFYFHGDTLIQNFKNYSQLVEVFIELMTTTGFSLYFKTDER